MRSSGVRGGGKCTFNFEIFAGGKRWGTWVEGLGGGAGCCKNLWMRSEKEISHTTHLSHICFLP